ncbi:hypothetical protein FOMG_18634 [Fusarium oxysporum f. sp. melonis 26406]|uniref:Uncharacterized protein n=1 Tax=Fusarium oxysporum f. sp. melonis 26406 TaxID=1089452 RepID=W9Z7T4_FUSOX|nr:hypothetical protein FOMG_18634 [Fusarium oxysporum f. sp. melonis 26406]
MSVFPGASARGAHLVHLGPLPPVDYPHGCRSHSNPLANARWTRPGHCCYGAGKYQGLRPGH